MPAAVPQQHGRRGRALHGDLLDHALSGRPTPAGGILPHPVFRATAAGHGSVLALPKIPEVMGCELGGAGGVLMLKQTRVTTG